jgi:hypothetical protein
LYEVEGPSPSSPRGLPSRIAEVSANDGGQSLCKVGFLRELVQ